MLIWSCRHLAWQAQQWFKSLLTACAGLLMQSLQKTSQQWKSDLNLRSNICMCTFVFRAINRQLAISLFIVTQLRYSFIFPLLNSINNRGSHDTWLVLVYYTATIASSSDVWSSYGISLKEEASLVHHPIFDISLRTQLTESRCIMLLLSSK